MAFLPHLAWQNTLWGFQSPIYFVVGFTLVALALLGAPERTRGRTAGGILAAVAAQLAMGPGLLVPVVLVGWVALRATERRQWNGRCRLDLGLAVGLLALAWVLHRDVPEHAGLRAVSAGQFFLAWARGLAWPHGWMPAAALVLNLPLAVVTLGRIAGKRRATPGEDFVLLMGGWIVVLAGAAAWARGGGHEFDAGVPSRYVDFLVLLPLANAWCTVVLVREAAVDARRLRQVLAVGWGAFLFMGWLGLSAEVMHRLVLPRLRDREAPVRLAVEFQQRDDPAVFAGQPPLFVPDPDLRTVRAVLHDPRMQGALPPSFQPERPLGPLSRVLRALLGR